MSFNQSRILLLMCAFVLTPFATHAAEKEKISIETISKAAATEASAKPGGVVRIGWARDDVPVTIDGLQFPPPAGLGSWAAFSPLPLETSWSWETQSSFKTR
jgi:hypothetical protein